MSEAEAATPGDHATGRSVLMITSGIHLTNDACFALLYPLLPFISDDLGLSYAQIGLMKAVFSGASSVLQIPAGAVGSRYGEMLVLLVGNAWVGLGLVLMALTGSFLALLLAAALGGIGGNAQHPLGSSIVSQAVPARQMATALGTLNFSGDVGKLIGPFVAGIVATQFGWRIALGSVGAFTVLFSLALLLRARSNGQHRERRIVSDEAKQRLPFRPGFQNVVLAGALDTATRGASLTFLSFVLVNKGFSAAAVSALFAVIFAGGAAGKFLCGWMTDRWGALPVIVLTESVTAAALIVIYRGPVWSTIPLVAVLGFMLNGTSSALNVSVAQFVPSTERARGYGVYFTAALVSSAISPLAFGVLGDAAGLGVVFAGIALMTVAVIPAVFPVRNGLDPVR
ncbi:MAG: MFS transporter [Thermomicrobiales bacterium]|nr:MFS transporter [Thermomicrobiales bacterium]